YSLPDHLCRFGVRAVCMLARGFSRQHRITEFTAIGYASPLGVCARRICLSGPLPACPSVTTDWYSYLPASPHRLTTTNPGPTQPANGNPRRGRSPTFWVVSKVASSGTRAHGYGNINPLSIDYACRPRLRSRLTLGGLAWPRNPWSFGGQGSHLPYRYSCLHSRFCILDHSITRWLHRIQNAPLPSPPCGGLPRLRRCA